MSDIQLNFINNSNDTNNSNIVIFQQAENPTFDETAIAWKVIQNCGRGDNHPFTYSQAVEVSASDSWGNFTPKMEANPGQAFSMVKNDTGDVLEASGQASSPAAYEINNELQEGAINGYCYRSGSVCAQKTGIAPEQKALFEFVPKLFIGVASDIEEGQAMDSAIISSINTELSLLGIKSADIVMTGGGAGADATPYTFTLENIVMA